MVVSNMHNLKLNKQGSSMTQEQALEFIQANASALGLPTDKVRLERVASHFIRTEAMAKLLDQVEYPADLEIAEIYCPKPIAS
jgi:EAL domain-containing protein (putative c-di-GMP-specific phosphodiesterase class I)